MAICTYIFIKIYTKIEKFSMCLKFFKIKSWAGNKHKYLFMCQTYSRSWGGNYEVQQYGECHFP